MKKTMHENVCDRYRQALEKKYIVISNPRPVMFLSSKEGNDETNFDAENNDRDLIKDVEYCPFCKRDGNIAMIHPKPDKFHPPTEIGNWCLEFWNSLTLGSIKYKKIEDSTGARRVTVSFNFVTGQNS
jgi:hypothetical protein